MVVNNSVNYDNQKFNNSVNYDNQRLFNKIVKGSVKPDLTTAFDNMNLGKVKQNVLRMGSTGKIVFRFNHSPEYLQLGMRFIFREGNCRGVGKITDLG